MEIVLCVLIASLFAVYLFLLLNKSPEPEFAVKGILSGEKLGYMMSSLAFGAKRVCGGKGIGTREIGRRLISARKKTGERFKSGYELELCEKTYYDGFYYIDETLSKLKSARKKFSKLPHVRGVPRLYSFCELFVKSVGGVVTRDAVKSAVRAYSSETPFTFAEITALADMTEFALCEYLAIYANKIARMGELISRGEQDAKTGKTDYSLMRYDSYVFGRMKNSECCVSNFSDDENARRRAENFVLASASYNARISAALSSLHAINAFMTDEFGCSLSSAFAVLDGGDPTFSMLSSSTKYMYLSLISSEAKKRKMSESSLASEILFRAGKNGKDISEYILPRVRSRAVGRLYVFAIVLAWLGAAAACGFFMPRFGWAYAVISLPILLYGIGFTVRLIAAHTVKRRGLPSYALESLSAEKHSTALLLPCLAKSERDIQDSFLHLQTLAAANSENIFSYCLLFDYPKSDSESADSDSLLNEYVKNEYEKLGALCKRVCVIVRKRTRVKGEEYFQGYEKKRGAVLDFNRFVLTGEEHFALRLGDVPKVKFAITLDSDTLTYDCAELVGTKAHPYCAEVAIVSLGCKVALKNSAYAKLYAGETGPGRYRAARPNLMFDVFGAGNFTGKGIYDVAAFSERLDGFFPDNRILSHDFIEGSVAGCYDSTVNASEDFPQSFADSFAREQRWLRGDWQLLPYAMPHIKNKDGARMKNPLPLAVSFAIVQNLVLSLVPIAQILVFVLSFFSPLSVGALILFALPQLLRALFSLVALFGYPKQTALEFARCAIELATLPTVAIHKLCAVAVTLYRLAVKRKLLEWSVFAHTRGKISFLPNVITAITVTAATALFNLSAFYYALAALFLAGAAIPRIISREKAENSPSDALSFFVTDTAKKTFAYFEAQENMHELPCDCYQEDNLKGWCARTSPTNIGMALTAYASAYELGIIDKNRLLSYTERIVSAVERCEKYKGNLYNWYDCATLKVLPKRFVSTVDSGNFLASLSLASTYADGELLCRINKLIDETDLSALYDFKRKLFYIGYDDELKSCTENHYDLLGSESALTYLVACGYGKTEKEAFGNLDRHAVKSGGAITVFSWTGGMFEYLMSRLFIAPSADTLLGQAMNGAVRAQLAYAKSLGREVWGVSECRYNEYDDAGGNLYRAFGVPSIAHSAVPENPPVAPYGAFLAMPYCEEKEFLRNAHALAALGCEGEWGFYESLCGNIPVKSYMTHHQGMIMAACANAQKADCLCKRLQTIPAWRAAKLLCGEEKASYARKKRIYEISDEAEPIENSGIYLCKAASMTCVANKKETWVQYCGKRLLQGIRVFADDGENTNLLGGEFYSGESAVWSVRGNGFIAESRLEVLPSPMSVAVTVRYRNVSAKDKQVTFSSCAEPILARVEDYESHPAYSRMFIDTASGGDGTYVWARRRKDSVTVMHCVQTENAVIYSADKCAFYNRGRGLAFGQNLNPVLSSKFSATVATGKTCEFTCCFLVADTVEKADYAVRLALSPDCVARQSGASRRLARAVSSRARAIAASLAAGEYEAVCADGVSQDKPAIVREITAASACGLMSYLSDLRTLCEAGFSFNVVLFCRKRRGEYPSFYFDAEKEVERSGLRSVCGCVRVLNCDGELYSLLKRHKPAVSCKKAVALCDAVKKLTNDEREESDCLSECKELFCAPEIAEPLGIGGFTLNGSYAVELTRRNTPAPWCNIMSDGGIGTVITESGGGFTFGENSRQHKLTEWCNDPVTETVSEFVAVEYDGERYSLTKQPSQNSRAEYYTVHALGYSEFICRNHGLSSNTRVYVARDENKKMYEVRLLNETDSVKKLAVLFAVRPVLGDFRRNTLPSLECSPFDRGLYLHCGFSGLEAYVCCDGKTVPVGVDCENGNLTVFDSISKGMDYWGIVASAVVPSGGMKTVRFSISSAKTDFSEINSCEEFAKTVSYYSRLSKITFDGEHGRLTEWLPYQVYNSRFAARTGFYQVSGAYGFRDQLQDGLALVHCVPALVREHILRCARHQFKEGDVQHWWHPPAIGVRTHMCDDRLWLVYVVCEYIAVTGDAAVLDESVPFLSDVPISPQDASVYSSANESGVRASLLEHCLRAIKISCDFGENGLVRMRGGDWNDAMDKVGEKGIGTTVWCTMFLYHVIERFLPYVKDIELCDELRRIGKALYGAVCDSYEDDRFLRAYADDGTALGSKESKACKIDILTQSWSVIAGIGSAEQKKTALDSAYNLLCNGENKLIRLFDPPFTSSDGVGYIGDYPRFVRENGGQYTQAAVWYVWALFQNGQTERANELLKWLNPANRCKTESDAEDYCVEPYVSAADVYGGELAGKGGWTWYTGSAAWLYKCLITQYAGITVRGDVVSFCPRLPKETKELNVNFLFGSENIKVKIINSSNGGDWRVRIGEVIYNTSSLRLTKGLSGKNIAVIRLLK